MYGVVDNINVVIFKVSLEGVKVHWRHDILLEGDDGEIAWHLQLVIINAGQIVEVYGCSALYLLDKCLL